LFTWPGLAALGGRQAFPNRVRARERGAVFQARRFERVDPAVGRGRAAALARERRRRRRGVGTVPEQLLGQARRGDRLRARAARV